MTPFPRRMARVESALGQVSLGDKVAARPLADAPTR